MSHTPRTLYEWFERSADQYGGQPALESDGDTLTYAELREYTEDIAARLPTASAGRRVGVLADRSTAAYAAYLAVLRTGGTIVPLSPEFPEARTRDMVAASDLDLVITTPGTPPPSLGVPVLAAPSRAAPGDSRPPAPPCPATPQDTAYIIFTSGSTGRPKGVPVLHRNISGYLSTVIPRCGAGPGSRFSQTFELTFDGSVYDLFVAWGSGATLVVPRRSQLLSPVKFINNQRITHWFSVPSLAAFAARLGTLRPDSMPTLRRSTFGGEALPTSVAREWQRAAPGSRVEVLYGPSELTISCTGYLLPPEPDDWPDTANGTAPIGESDPGLELLILDESGAPASEGELCARGPQRFPGYLDPADNAGRFLSREADGHPVPYTGDSPLTDRHWYRTGDRVQLHHGLLVHQGRVDHQVKIRGHRIELGEIESLLGAQPGVHDAVVLVTGNRGGEPDLEAAVAAPGCAAEQLHEALSERLPPYMLPRTIEILETLPRNAHGKIDRAALAATLQNRRP